MRGSRLSWNGFPALGVASCYGAWVQTRITTEQERVAIMNAQERAKLIEETAELAKTYEIKYYG